MPGRKDRAAEVAVIRPAQPRTTLSAVAGATERRLTSALEVPLDQLAPDPAQPRRDWEHDSGAARLEDLAASIREFGILQPLVVHEDGVTVDGRQRYVIIAGGRRFAAASRVGLTTVPVVVRGDEAARVRVLQLIENIQRQDLSPLDEARAYQELMDVEKLSPPALATRLHVSAQHVRDRLRLLGDQVLADAVERGQISGTAARDILQLPDDERNALRSRVGDGEVVQHGEIAAVRSRLAATGVVNPQRKRGGKKQTTFVPEDLSKASVDGTVSESRWLGDQIGTHPKIIKASIHLTPPRIANKQIHTPDYYDTEGLPDIVAAAIGKSLNNEQLVTLAAVLNEYDLDTPEMAAWWLRVEQKLRQHLGVQVDMKSLE